MYKMKFKNYFFKPIAYYQFVYLVYLGFLSFFSAAYVGGYFYQLLKPFADYRFGLNFLSLFLALAAIFQALLQYSLVLAVFPIIAIYAFVLPKYLPNNFWRLTQIFVYPLLLSLIQWLFSPFSWLNYFVYLGIILFLGNMIACSLFDYKSKHQESSIYLRIAIYYATAVVFISALLFFYDAIVKIDARPLYSYIIFLVIFGISVFESARVTYQQIYQAAKKEI